MYTFKKEERLCNKRLLEKLFRSGSSFILYPFRIVTLPVQLPDLLTAQVVITVSKSRFKKSPDRNLLKRRIREAYRHQKADFLYPVLKTNQIQMLLGISYIGKEILDYDMVYKKLNAALLKIAKHYCKNAVE